MAARHSPCCRFWGQKGWKDAFLRANNFFVNYENDIKLAAGLGGKCGEAAAPAGRRAGRLGRAWHLD